MLPFLLILVATLASGFQYSNPALGAETDESSDTSEARVQGSSETQSEEASATSNTSGTETDESKNASKRFLSGLGDAKIPPTGGKVLAPGNAAPVGTNSITVSFNSITVHKNHEGGSWGNGEWNLFAWVQDKKVDLTRASGPGDGLWDVSNGETLTFNQAYVTTELPDNVPLSIFTIGHEVDRCGRGSFGGMDRHLPWVFSHPPQDWSSLISPRQHFYNDQLGNCNTVTPYGWNDPLGKILEFYQPPGYGAGRHEVKSSSGDFTLRYTISGPDTCGQNIC